MKIGRFFWGVGLWGMLIGVITGEDFGFEIPDDSPSRLELHGNFDGKWGVLQTRPSSVFYGLRFFDVPEKNDYLSQYRLDFYLNGDYRLKQVGFFVRTFTQYVHDEPIQISLFEMYGSLNLSARLTAGLGKQRYTWGKGYAFNPAGFINAEKDPENPDLALSGRASAYAVYNRSFSSEWVQNVSVSGIFLPPAPDVSDRYGAVSHTGGALKLYFLVRNIDIDVMAFRQKDEPQQYGLDFSTNIKPNFEIHGEWSYVQDAKQSILQNDRIVTRQTQGTSYLVGIRYLNPWNTTLIAEYYHTFWGLSQNEFKEAFSFLQGRINNGDSQAIREAGTALSQVFRSKTWMQEYLYVKVSQPEPFGWLYATVSAFAICNLKDKSVTVSPQLAYKPYTNFTFLLWPTLFVGGENTEYGSKQFKNKVEIWAQFYF